MELKKNKVIVQIGTNWANDEFNQMAKECSPSKVILVEPNSDLIDEINKNYIGVDNVHVENVAITNINKGEVELVIPKDRDNGTTSVNGIHYGHAGFTLLPMNDWGDDFVSIKAKSMTFSELCDKYEIDDIHFLQIDTEGYDAEIIKSIDFNKINIDMIKYELWGFPEESFSRHGEDKKKYGVNGMNYVSKMLIELGYTLHNLQYDMLAIKNKI